MNETEKHKEPYTFTSSGWGGGYTYVEVGPRQYRRQHILIAEKAFGGPLPEGAVVHHANGIRTDNRNINLVICENEKYHRMLHARQRVVDAGGNPDTEKICGICGAILPKSEFQKHRSHYDGLRCECRRCCSQYQKANRPSRPERRRLKALRENGGIDGISLPEGA